jgi:hypothetical protein
MFVVQDFITKQYSHYTKVEDFWSWYSTLHVRHYNEFIEHGPQKMRLDIESHVMVKDWNSIILKCYTTMKELINNAKLVVYEMSDNEKHSCHIICYNVMFDNNDACRELCNKIIQHTGINFIDIGVYGKRQHFRLEGSCKPYAKRCKLVTHTDAEEFDYRHGIITYSSGCTSCKVSIPKEIQCPYIVMLEWCVPISMKGNIIQMRRIKPSFCDRCKRVHDSENPYIVIVNKKTAYIDCRRGGGRQYLKVNNLEITL